MVPKATVEAEASKLLTWPATFGVTDRWATGAWSGVMAMAIELVPATGPTGMGVPGVLVAVSMGVTVCESRLPTYAVWPFGVMAMECGPLSTGMAVPGVLVAVSMGVTVSETPVGLEAVGAVGG